MPNETPPELVAPIQYGHTQRSKDWTSWDPQKKSWPAHRADTLARLKQELSEPELALATERGEFFAQIVIKHGRITQDMNFSLTRPVLNATAANAFDQSTELKALPTDPAARLQHLKNRVVTMNTDSNEDKVRWMQVATRLINAISWDEDVHLPRKVKLYKDLLSREIAAPYLQQIADENAELAQRVARATSRNTTATDTESFLHSDGTSTIDDRMVCGKTFSKIQDSRTVHFMVTGTSWMPETGRNFVVQMENSTAAVMKTELEMQELLAGCSEDLK